MDVTDKKNHKSLFSDKDKIKAFDKIAEHYYNKNFGTMAKSDFDVLMFSIYLDQILDKHEDDYNQYSDYELAKLLGIPQGRIRTLKEKKQLKYPYKKFDWKISFKRVCENYQFDNGKFVIELRDRNLFLEVKNHIETHGGYIENALSGTLLKVSPEFFIQLLAEIYGGEKSVNDIKMQIQEKINKDAFKDGNSLSKGIKNVVHSSAKEIFLDIIKSSIPGVGGILSIIVDKIFDEVSK